jgi:hypothetical protein
VLHINLAKPVESRFSGVNFPIIGDGIADDTCSIQYIYDSNYVQPVVRRDEVMYPQSLGELCIELAQNKTVWKEASSTNDGLGVVVTKYLNLNLVFDIRQFRQRLYHRNYDKLKYPWNFFDDRLRFLQRMMVVTDKIREKSRDHRDTKGD